MSYAIYIAEIVGVASAGNTRLQVRVLPQLEGIADEYLPVWPYFFQHQAITGKKGELVWCIANTDLSVGYILGFVNKYSWNGTYEENSIPQTLMDQLDDVHVELRGKLFSYKDIIVTFWNETSMHFIERSTGAHITALTTGTLSIVRPDEIIMAVAGKSMINMSADEITITASKIRLSGDVRLGSNPQGKVLVTQGVLGQNGLPAESVWA